MFKKLKGTVHMPPMPRRGMDVHSWCEAVFKALKQVRSMGVDIPAQAKAAGSTHPFKATPNGDDTVNIAPGSVISWFTNNSNTLDNAPFYGDEQNFLGDDVTVTGTGTIYLVVTTGLTEVSYDSFGAIFSQVYRATAAPTVEFDPTFTGTNLYLPIADVSLTDGVAAITRQLLDHNPLLQLGFAYENTP